MLLPRITTLVLLLAGCRIDSPEPELPADDASTGDELGAGDEPDAGDEPNAEPGQGSGSAGGDTEDLPGTACGDGELEGSEECELDGEGSFLFRDGVTCASLGFVEGLLWCDPITCTIDSSECSTCGNGVIDPGELCDGDDLGGLSCTDYGAVGGDLVCIACMEIDPMGCIS